MSHLNTQAAAEHAMQHIDARQIDNMAAEIQMNSQLHLVPSRWERSGWRYVQRDPADVQFFQNPNRVNNFGVDSQRKRFASSNMRGTFYKSQNRSAFGQTNKSRFQDTTYGANFYQHR